ncbi:hypothetical protein [Paenibacillus chitinolyticus]|uniref:hypothetical protein n=1 Tax=Paenibacillus chitinolyticus TaxID=79263 RepID=UPI003D001ACD
MAIFTKRRHADSLLELKSAEDGLFKINHIYEPEFHQDKYVDACIETSKLEDSFQIGDEKYIAKSITRGKQPFYADNEDDPDSLFWEGMVLPDGTRLIDEDCKENVCALKSNSVRSGFIDTSLARSVTREFYEKNKDKAGVKKNDILINSTGDGTIGRVAVFNYDFPAVVDGHITIVRFKDPVLAWYVAAFLQTETGQNQIYRYINGSSGQVEIYPQDIGRIWVKPCEREKMSRIAKSFEAACKKHDDFYKDLKAALYDI